MRRLLVYVLTVGLVLNAAALGFLGAAPAASALGCGSGVMTLACTLPGTSTTVETAAAGGAIPIETEGLIAASGAGAVDVTLPIAAFGAGFQAGCWIAGAVGISGSCPSIGELLGFGSSDSTPTTTLGPDAILSQLDGGNVITGHTLAHVNFSIASYPSCVSSGGGSCQGFLSIRCTDPTAARSYDPTDAYQTPASTLPVNGLGYVPSGNYTVGLGTDTTGNADFICPGHTGGYADTSYYRAVAFISSVSVYQNGYGFVATINYPKPVTYAVTETHYCQKGSTTATAQGLTVITNGVRTDGTDIPSCETVLPGSHMVDLTATGSGNGGKGLTIDAPTWNDPARSDYPSCTNGAVACVLDLRKSGQSCFDGAVICKGWLDHTTDYTCHWFDLDHPGVTDYQVPLSWCETKFGHTFDTEIIPDPNPTTSTSPTTTSSTSPSTSPSTSGDPGPGGQPDPSGSGSSSTSTSTGPSDSPSSSGTTVPPPGAGGGEPDPGRPPLPADGDEGCVGSIGTNPFDWPLKLIEIPVKCALRWAFVPSAASLQSFVTTVRTAYNATAIGEWASAVGGLVGAFDIAGSDCGGITFHIPAMLGSHGGQDVRAFDTCVEPWHGISLVVRALLTVMIVWACAIGVFRNIAAAFGYDAKIGSRS